MAQVRNFQNLGGVASWVQSQPRLNGQALIQPEERESISKTLNIPNLRSTRGIRWKICWPLGRRSPSGTPVTPLPPQQEPSRVWRLGPAQHSPARPAQQAAPPSWLRLHRLPITWTLQMAQVSHSTSQLHMATAFHFLRENILSPPDLEPALPECEERTQGSSPSSTSAMAAAQNGDADVGRGGGRYGGSAGPQHRPRSLLQARAGGRSQAALIGWRGTVTSRGWAKPVQRTPALALVAAGQLL